MDDRCCRTCKGMNKDQSEMGSYSCSIRYYDEGHPVCYVLPDFCCPRYSAKEVETPWWAEQAANAICDAQCAGDADSIEEMARIIDEYWKRAGVK